MRIVGFDGKKIRRLIKNRGLEQPSWFEALLGVGVTVADYKEFAQKYDALIERFFYDNGLTRNKTLYKGMDLTSIFYGKGINLIPELVKQLLPLVEFVDIYFHHIPLYYDREEKIPNRIGAYYEEEIQYLSNVKFIELIQNHFPALCCYSYLADLKSEIEDTFYCIDDCPNLLQSRAIVGIIKNPNTRFLFRGDQTNYAVNAADVFCRYVEETTKKENLKIDPELVKNLGLPEEKVEYHYISPKWLSIIKPARRAKLNVSHKYPHPIYFLFSEKDSAFNNSQEAMEHSVLFRGALKKASAEAGSVKFFEVTDQEYINENDFLIPHTKSSDDKVAELKRMGCPAKVIDFTFLQKK